VLEPIRRWLYAGGTRQDRLRDPDAVIAVLDLRPGMIVGDLGPGYGHFTLGLARAVAPDGVVYALDASRNTLEELQRAADDKGITTMRAVPVPRDRIEIPESVDLLFVSATYHHLPDPARYFAGVRPYLRTGARVAILESRREGLLARWHGPHATSPRRVQQEMEDAGYRLTATHDIVRGYWYGLFEVAGEAIQPTDARRDPLVVGGRLDAVRESTHRARDVRATDPGRATDPILA
jgi:predicted methyltransferase